MINAINLGMRFGPKALFENVSFQLNYGNRYGLVGANGSGKSTLLKIFSGEVTPESGSVEISSSVKIGLLKQDHFLYNGDRIIDVVLKGKPALWNALTEKHDLLSHESISDEAGKRLAELEIAISDNDGYQAEADAGIILMGLGISAERHADLLDTLSGGYKLRVLLAQVLFSQPDFLLLDEPNNHLDMASIIWLEAYLRSFTGTCLVISHDQYFLDRISTHIIDIDYETISIFTGGYFDFLKAKELTISQKESEISRQEKKKEEIQTFINRFKAKATKARQANSKAKQLERMDDIVIRRSSRRTPRFDFKICRPSGKVAFDVKQISKMFDESLILNNVSLNVNRGEKLAVIGPNGIGKSTFLKILAGKLQPTSGDVTPGYEVYPGYCPQDHQELLPDDTTPFEWLYSFDPGADISKIRGILGRVLIQGDEADKRTNLLSGGEAARLIFAQLILTQPNLLLLDEPTNHMDIESLEALGDSLSQYEGTIVCVSHDRRFIETFATSVLELNANGFNLFDGDYQRYLEKSGIDYLDRTSAQNQFSTASSSADIKLGAKERRDKEKEIKRVKSKIKRHESKITTLEKTIEEMDQKLAANDIYLPENKAELNDTLQEKDALKQSLEEEEQGWVARQEELEELMDTLSGAKN